MRVTFHPGFSKDILKYGSPYSVISDRLEGRFREDLDRALAAIKDSPRSAGHFLNVPHALGEVRRKNLRDFPFFVLYGLVADEVFVVSLIPSRSDPLTWLSRFSSKKHL